MERAQAVVDPDTGYLPRLSSPLRLAHYPDTARRAARRIGISVLLVITLLTGTNGPLAQGIGISVPSAQAAPMGTKGSPNRANPHAGSASTLHLPAVPKGSSTNVHTGPAQPIHHGGFQPRSLGRINLDPMKGGKFVAADDKFEVDVPAGAVTTADVNAAGGVLGLQVAQIAPPSGSNAGGSGIISFGSFLLQVVDAHGVLAKQGLNKPVTVMLHIGQAAGLNPQHAFVLLNGGLPTNLTTVAAASTTAASSGTASKTAQLVSSATLGLGQRATQPAKLARTGDALVAGPLTISTPSTSMSWNTTSPIAYFGKPDLFNADLSAGSLAASLPIDVPAGPGGLTPPISLAYSSAAVSENQSVQAAAGWVGEGWNLAPGSINWSERDGTAGCVANQTCYPVMESQWQLSDPYGTGSELIPPNNSVATYYDDTPNTYFGSNYRATILADSPAAYYRLDESPPPANAYGGPAAIYDSSGNNVTSSAVYGGGSVAGLIAGDRDAALSWSGGAHAELNAPFSYVEDGKRWNGRPFSMECWFEINSYPSSWSALLSMGSNGPGNSIIIQLNSSGSLLVTNLAGSTTPSAPVSLNVPHHAVATFDGSSIYTLYLDGALVSSVNGGQLGPLPGQANAEIADWNCAWHPCNPFNGVIDEAGFYRYQLSANQVQAHYAAGTAAATYINLPTVWHTASESYAKIISYRNTTIDFGNHVNPPCFRVWLKNGIMEEFGCTQNSLMEYVVVRNGLSQYYISSWLLDMITDPQGNQIQFTYQQDLESQNGLSYPRDAVLSSIQWDSPTCHSAQTMCTGSAWAPLMQVSFSMNHTVTRLTNSPSGCNTGPSLRCDDPNDLSQTTCPGTSNKGLAAPAVQSDYVLNDLYVQVRNSGTAGWNTLKDYQFSYEQSGPGQITDPSTGQCESTAGYLDLTQFTVVGDDGTTALPTRTFSYASKPEYYEDDTYRPNPTTNCGPTWNTGSSYDSNQCILWSTTYDGNSRYLNSASNGMGLAQSFIWTDARSNMHGANNGVNGNPLACNDGNGNPIGSYPCDEADDQEWSHVVLMSQTGSVIRAASSGNVAVNGTTAYTYTLTTGWTGKECGDCNQGMYWGNENENDYLDYYNAKYMGFAETDVSNPDGSLVKHKYYATTGWGVYDNSQITNCAPNMQPSGPTPCPNDPWWNLTNAAHGHEYETDSYDTNGATLLKQTTTQYQAVCPPSGVSGTGSVRGYGNFNGNLVSELDLSNPVAVCDVQTTRTDAYTYDGSSASGVPDQTTTYSYDSYGRVTTSTTTSNNGGATGSPTTLVTFTNYVYNDAISTSQTSATGTYLIDLTASATVEDSSGHVYSCHYKEYDGLGFTAGAQSGLHLGELSATDVYTGTQPSTVGETGCDYGGLWINSQITYDSYGNAVSTNDPDSVGNSAHLGCTVAGSTTTHSTCSIYDTTFAMLPTSTTNAFNQTSTTGYGAQSSAATGFGLWPMSTTDANNQTTTYGYDGLGRMVSETLPGEGSGLTTASWTYTNWCSGTSAQTPCLELDETKRLNGTTTITNRAFYDGYGDLVETRNQGPSGQDVVAYADYDASGHMTFESNSYFVTAYSGGPGASAYSIPDTTQAGTKHADTNWNGYDGLGRTIKMQDPLSNTTTTSYTVVCNSISGDSACYEQALVTDANSHQSGALTDALGRQIYVQNYTGNTPSTYVVYATTKYTYDYNGNQTQILQPDGVSKTTTQFDRAGRKTGMTDPDRGTESYSYDANGNLMRSVDARGSAGTVYAGYDGLDRLLWRNSSNSPTNAYATFSYDSTANGNVGVGRLTSETFTGGPNNTLSGSYAYAFDQRGQQINSTLTIGSSSYPVQKTYDDAGNTLTQTYPDGEVVTTGYTAQGWFAGLSTQQGSSNTTLVSAVTYTSTGGAASLMTGASLGNGLYQYTADYDLNHRLTTSSLTRNRDKAVLFQTQPSYDAVSNVVGVTTTLQAGTDNQAFCYDEQNRLTWASSNSGNTLCGGTNTAGTLTAAQYTQSFSYDNLGRLTSGPLGSYTYGDSAHLHAATAIGPSGSPTWTASYDAAGDMTCRAPTTSSTCAGTQTGAQLSYNLEGYPVSWQNAPSNPSTTDSYLYDGEGNRVAQQVTTGLPGSPSTTTTIYVGNVEEVATSGSTATTTTYYYAGGTRIAEAVNGTVSYLGNDALGSADVALDSSSGNTTAAQLSAPYGTVRYSSGTMPTDYGFTGQHSDSVTGLDYYVSRYYDPLAGQFTSADTVLPGNGYDPLGLSRYAYVQGNPEGAVDPSGHFLELADRNGGLTGEAYYRHMAAVLQDDSQQGRDSMLLAVGLYLNDRPLYNQINDYVQTTDHSYAIQLMAGQEAITLQHSHSAAYWNARGQTGIDLEGALFTGLIATGSSGAEGPRLTPEMLGMGGISADQMEGPLTGANVCGESFAAGTPVATPAGQRAIDTLHVGDHVLARDPVAQTVSTQSVEHVFIDHDTDLLDVTLRVTVPAPVHSQPAAAKKSQGASHSVAPSTSSTHSAPVATTSLTETVHTTNTHPWLTADAGWLPASFLRIGEPVMRVDGMATVEAIRVVPGAANMWDLTVNHVHTFAVGAGAYVVHNCGTSGSPDASNKVPGQDDLYYGKPRTDVSKQAGWRLVRDDPSTSVNSGEFRGYIEETYPGYQFSDQDWTYRSQTWQRGNTRIELHFWEGGAMSDPDNWDFTGQYYHHH